MNMKLNLKSGACGIAMSAAAVMAWLPDPARSQATEGQVGLEGVIVTAQKREERLQDVPISITALTSEQLEIRGIKSLEDLNALAPNVMFRANPGAKLISTVSIRGSVTNQPAIWVDPSVGLYLNGVYLGKAQGSVFDVVDIERVEVLRGPQGTLFGRNTEGGAINFITRKPSGEFQGSTSVEFGNFDHKAARVSLDLPRFGIASVSLAARKEDHDGFVDNLTGPDLGAVDSEAFRASMKLDFSDRFDATYDFDYSNADNTPVVKTAYSLRGWRGGFPEVFGPAIGIPVQDAIAPYVSTTRPDIGNTTPGIPIFERGKNNAHALTLSYKAGDRDEIKYIFARRSLFYNDSQDNDGTPLESISLPSGAIWRLSNSYDRRTKYDQDSHELQWVGDRERFSYVLGLYYFKDDGVTRGAQSSGLYGALPQVSSYASITDAKAVFAQADYRITDRWTATAGIRYTEEEKSGWSHRFRTDGFGGAFIADILPFTAYSEDFSGTTPMAAISFKPNENLNFYARIAKGFKSGGFSSEVSDPQLVVIPYEPQSSVSTEIGMKSTLLDGRLRFNLAFYNADISDQQNTQLLPGTTQSLMRNAGESTYRGIEVEAAAMIVDGWQVQLGYGYLDAKYDKYIDNAILPPLTPGGAVRAGGPLIDTASNRLPPYAPEHTLNVAVDGRLLRTPWGELRGILDYTYTAEMYLYAVNKSLTAPNAGGQYIASVDGLPAIRNLNARLLLAGLKAGPGTLDLSLWGRNLTDEDKLLQAIDASMFMVGSAYQDPRTYMFTATYKW